MHLARQIATFKRLREKPVWRLLAGTNSYITLAVLQKHLLEGDRRVPQSILIERVEQDLDELRAEGQEHAKAQILISSWLSSGFIERHFPLGAAEEEYEISSGAAQAIRFITGLEERRTSATESRLSTVIYQLTNLVEATDRDQKSRLASLVAEKDKIERQIKEVELGHFKVLDDVQALERAREIIALSQELINDFRHVRDEFDTLNRELRAKLLGDNENRGDVLEVLFSGVDLISESPHGATFAAFWRLLIDPEQNKTLDDNIAVLLARPFCGTLTLEERLFLRKLISNMLEQGELVHIVLQNFARSLKHFVQSREFLEQKHINSLLGEAQRSALALKEIVAAADKLAFELPKTSCSIKSLAQMKLMDPSLGLADLSVTNAPVSEISVEMISDLMKLSDINYAGLKNNIKACLMDAQQVSVGNLLNHFPAEQGLGSIVGYMSLACKHEQLITEHKENIVWQSDEQLYSATIPLIFFLRSCVNEF